MGCGCLQQIRSGSSLGDGVDSINNSREVAKEGEKQADPKLHPAAKLEEDTKRRQDDGQQDVYASSCSLVCHLLNSSERSIYTALEKLFFFLICGANIFCDIQRVED